jgi:hypothetical protein
MGEFIMLILRDRARQRGVNQAACHPQGPFRDIPELASISRA